MKILYINSGFLPDSTGGTELHAFYLAREMARNTASIARVESSRRR